MRRKLVWGIILAASISVVGGAYVFFVFLPSLEKTFNEVANQLEDAAPPKKDVRRAEEEAAIRNRREAARQKRDNSERRAAEETARRRRQQEAQKPPSSANGDSADKARRPFEFEIQKADDSYTVVRVFYATDRNKKDMTDPKEIYGIERSELTYGFTEVSIPKDHRVGELESPSIWKLEFKEDPEKHVVLLKVEELEKDKYFQEISNRVRESSSKSAFLFVHGFNVTFEHAARRTAQMTYDLNFSGAPVFYSWPSQGSYSSYTIDENNIEWTEQHLEMFLVDFAEHSMAEKIYLVAHSMGSRALTKAIAAVAEKDASFREKIEAIILAAPDIDADIFKDSILPKIKPVAKNLTIYASSKDKALIASKQVHGYARAGEVGPKLVIEDGVDTVDASSVDTSFIGHSYYAEAKSIVADLFEILKFHRTANERLNLALLSSNQGNLWVFKPAAKILTKEPPLGGLSPGVVRYIDDETCGDGLIKKIIEGDATNSIQRSISCVPN